MMQEIEQIFGSHYEGGYENLYISQIEIRKQFQSKEGRIFNKNFDETICKKKN